MQLTNDYRGRDFTGSLSLGQIDIVRNSGIVVCQYLQSVTKAISLGAELMYQKGQQLPGGQVPVLTVGGKYNGNSPSLLSPFHGMGIELVSGF